MAAPSNTTTTLSNWVKTIFDRSALFSYRAANVFRAFADVKPSDSLQPQRGNVVDFEIISALSVATTALTEDVDVTPVALAQSSKTVTLVEQGNATKSTKKLRLTSFVDLDLAAVHEITANMEESMDVIARNIMVAGSNVTRPNGHAKNAIVATDNLTAALISQMRSKLAGQNTPPPPGSALYGAVIHPDITFDVINATGQNAWLAPHSYVDPQNIYAGELGTFGGFRFIENANAKNDVDAGSGGTVDVYHTLFLGQNFVGEAVGDPQHVVIAGPFDDLQRFVSVGWYALMGYGRIRENSCQRIECASSIGAN